MGQPNGNGYAMNGKNGNGNADHSIHDIEMENTSDRDALLMEERRANEQPINEKPAPPKEEPASRQMVIFSILFYLVAAIVMVMANKWVLNAVAVPLFFLFNQLAIAVLLLHISAVLGYFRLPKIELETCKGLAPLISINVVGLIFNTYCLQFVDASFYQIARGLVLPFTVLFSYFLLQTRSSLATYSAVAVVCVGFFLGVSAEHLTVSTVGVFFGVFSSITTAVHAIVVKRSLGVVKGSTLDLVYYNNLLSAAVVGPTVLLSGEWVTVVEMFAAGGKSLQTFLIGAVVTGVFGFLICIAGFLSIKVTSPVSHMISSAVRGVIQTFLGMWLFGDIITSGRAAGIAFILGGSIFYTWSKDQESRAAKAAPAASQASSSSANNDASQRLNDPVSRSNSGSSTSHNRRPSSQVRDGQGKERKRTSMNLTNGDLGVGKVDVVVHDEKAALKERRY